MSSSPTVLAAGQLALLGSGDPAAAEAAPEGLLDALAQVLAAYLSAHRTMINGSALCTGLAVTERD
jgi:hypothetical protein